MFIRQANPSGSQWSSTAPSSCPLTAPSIMLLPKPRRVGMRIGGPPVSVQCRTRYPSVRSEEHTSELQSLMRNSYAVFCLKKKKHQTNITRKQTHTITTQH